MGESEKSAVGKVIQLKYEVNCGRNYLAKSERSIVGGTVWPKVRGQLWVELSG